MEISDLKSGSIVKGKRWKEPVKIDNVESMGSYIRIIGSTLRSCSHIDQLIPLDEIPSLSMDKLESNFSSPPGKVFLAFETKRYRMLHCMTGFLQSISLRLIRCRIRLKRFTVMY